MDRTLSQCIGTLSMHVYGPYILDIDCVVVALCLVACAWITTMIQGSWSSACTHVYLYFCGCIMVCVIDFDSWMLVAMTTVPSSGSHVKLTVSDKAFK